MAITELIVTWAVSIINQAGVGGIFVLMTLESMIAPIPSEGVMPFAGFLLFEGKMTVLQILISSTLGSLVGSLVSYYIGARYGEAVIKRWGKYLFLNEHHLEQTKRFFARYGNKTVFVSRFIPIVRHLISIPAGVGKMNLLTFTLYTGIGATMWNMFLVWVGYRLASRWEVVQKYSHVLDIVVVVVIVVGIIYLVWKKRQPRNIEVVQ